MTMEMSAKTQDESKSNRAIVIQMGDFSDVLRSLMALKAVKQLYPNLEIWFVSKKAFEIPVSRVHWIKKAYGMPVDDFVNPVLNDGLSEKEVIGAIANWSKPLIQEPWDFLVDWTYSEVSSYLSAIIPSYVKLGFTRNDNGAQICADDWSQYIQGVVHSGLAQNVHLTDIMTTQFLTALQIHSGAPDSSQQNSPVTGREFFNVRLNQSMINRFDGAAVRKWVMFQIGISDLGWSWSNENWMTLLESIISRHPDYGVILFASKPVEDLDRAFHTRAGKDLFESGRVKILWNNPTFDEWVLTMGQGSVLISSDSASLNMASLLGVRTIGLNAGRGDHYSSAPYGNGHLLLDGKDIDANLVYQVWKSSLRDWLGLDSEVVDSAYSEIFANNNADKFELTRSRIRSVDDGGGVIFENLKDSRLSTHQWVAMVNGYIARCWYCGWAPSIDVELSNTQVDSKVLSELRTWRASVGQIYDVLEKCVDVSTQLVSLTQETIDGAVMSVEKKEEIKKLGMELANADRVLEGVCDQVPILQGVSNLFKVMMHNLKGNSIKEISVESCKAYQRVADGAFIVLDWMDKTFEASKPRAIPNPGDMLDGGISE